MPGRRLLLALVLWLALGGAAIGLTVVGLRTLARPWATGHPAIVAAVGLAEAYAGLLLALALAFGLGGLRERLALRFTSAIDLAVSLVVWLAALFVGVFTTSLLAPLLGETESNAVSLLRLSLDPLFLALILPTVCLLAPLGEELLFRGALFGWLRQRLPAWLAIVITAAVFAGSHLVPTLFPVQFVFGLATTWIRERTGSTLNTFAMHACQNTLAVTVAYVLLTQSAR